MAGLSYVGKSPATTRDVETRLHTEGVLQSGISRGYVDGRVTDLAASRATKVYVDEQDSEFAETSYYPAQDLLLVPNAAKGAASGVASLDGSAKVPTAQIPVLGAGILRGPYGPDQYFGGTTGTTPLKIAQWNPAVLGYTGQLLVWLNVSAQSIDGRPVIEVRAGNSTQTTYAAQTLIAQGVGREHFNDYQMITVVPVTALDGEGQDGVQDATPGSTNLLVNVWMYDDAGGQVTTAIGLMPTAALFIARTAL